MGEPSIATLIEWLRSADAESAWRQFLDQYTPILYQSARGCSRDEDESAGCFLYICEELAKSDFRRLRQFRQDGTASFVTWLRAIARNLCVDRMHKSYGADNLCFHRRENKLTVLTEAATPAMAGLAASSFLQLMRTELSGAVRARLT